MDGSKKTQRREDGPGDRIEEDEAAANWVGCVRGCSGPGKYSCCVTPRCFCMYVCLYLCIMKIVWKTVYTAKRTGYSNIVEAVLSPSNLRNIKYQPQITTARASQREGTEV